MTTTNQSGGSQDDLNFRSSSETGHAKNVANFEELITTCQSFVPDYNPSNNLISIPELQILLTQAQESIDHVHTSRASFMLTTNQRQDDFDDLKFLSTKIINALAASGADHRALKDAKTINNKIQGKPATPKTNDNEEGQETKRVKSSSQQSFDKLIDHFRALIELLAQIPEYDPNEVNLQINSLYSKLTQLKNINSEHIVIYTDYSKKLAQRNLILYAPITGVITIAKLIKQYVKSLFGINSHQYQQISGIQIIKQKL